MIDHTGFIFMLNWSWSRVSEHSSAFILWCFFLQVCLQWDAFYLCSNPSCLYLYVFTSLLCYKYISNGIRNISSTLQLLLESFMWCWVNWCRILFFFFLLNDFARRLLAKLQISKTALQGIVPVFTFLEQSKYWSADNQVCVFLLKLIFTL